MNVLSSVLFVDLRRHDARGEEGARNRSADWKRATWQRRAPDRAQCRFKMAAVRDRYRGISVENVRFCDATCGGSIRAVPWDLGAYAPHPAPAPDPLKVRISNHIAPTLCPPYIGSYRYAMHSPAVACNRII